MNFKTAPIAMTDLETTGSFFWLNEIIEIGLVLFDQNTFEIFDTLDLKIKLEHPEHVNPEAVALNGYDPKKWSDAVSLKEAITQYVEKTKNAVFASYNVSFDWPFMMYALHQSGFPYHMNSRENHDRLDLLSLAWAKGTKEKESFSLKTACGLFDIPPEPLPHSALNGAMTAYELWKKLAQL